MTILFAIATGIIGALFWADQRRRYYRPIILNDNRDIVDNDVQVSCDDGCENAETYRDDDQDDGGSSSDYGGSSTSDSRDD